MLAKRLPTILPVLSFDESLETSKVTSVMGLVTISRANSTVAYPAQFMLVAAMNPCPCGFFNSQEHETCS